MARKKEVEGPKPARAKNPLRQLPRSKRNEVSHPTVGQLRRFLESLPDEAVVVFRPASSWDNGWVDVNLLQPDPGHEDTPDWDEPTYIYCSSVSFEYQDDAYLAEGEYGPGSVHNPEVRRGRVVLIRVPDPT